MVVHGGVKWFMVVCGGVVGIVLCGGVWWCMLVYGGDIWWCGGVWWLW